METEMSRDVNNSQVDAICRAAFVGDAPVLPETARDEPGRNIIAGRLIHAAEASIFQDETGLSVHAVGNGEFVSVLIAMPESRSGRTSIMLQVSRGPRGLVQLAMAIDDGPRSISYLRTDPTAAVAGFGNLRIRINEIEFWEFRQHDLVVVTLVAPISNWVTRLAA